MTPLRQAGRNPDDWIATATAFTARTIADAYHRFLLNTPGLRVTAHHQTGSKQTIADKLEVVLCGGGARNVTLRHMLSALLPQASVRTIDELGIPSEAKESVSFAVLARAYLDGAPANLPQGQSRFDDPRADGRPGTGDPVPATERICNQTPHPRVNQ